MSNLFILFILCSAILVIAEAKRGAQVGDMNSLFHASSLSLRPSLAPALTATMNISSFKGITWTHVTIKSAYGRTPDKGDWVGLYLASTPPPGRAPIKFINAQNLPGYLKTGKSTFPMQLIPMRDDVRLYTFSNGTDSPIMEQAGPLVTLLAKNSPSQPFVTLASGHTSASINLLVRWRGGQCNGKETLRFGATPNTLDTIVPATCKTFTNADMCSEPAIKFGYADPGQIFFAPMSKLKFSTSYFYQFGDNVNGLSSIFELRTPPRAGDSVRAIVFGDYGKVSMDGLSEYSDQSESAATTISLTAERDETDAIVHIGDISYAWGYIPLWDVFGEQISPFSSRVPYLTAIGNHEMLSKRQKYDALWIQGDSGGECGVPYHNFFQMPGTSIDKPWYSFDLGVIHFTIMSTEQNWTVGSEQYQWLENDLASVDRSVTPWLIFAGHKPMYCSSTEGLGSNATWPPVNLVQGVAPAMQERLEPLLLKYQVDMAMWGHAHSYQRTCAIAQGRCVNRDEGGIVHLIVGMAGFVLDADFQRPQPEIFEVVNEVDYGYSKITATQEKLIFEFHANEKRQVKDSFVLTSRHK